MHLDCFTRVGMSQRGYTNKRAAELRGCTMADFVVAAVQDAAQRAIERADVVRLSLADQECFAQALRSPPKPSLALKRAFVRRRKHLRAE